MEVIVRGESSIFFNIFCRQAYFFRLKEDEV